MPLKICIVALHAYPVINPAATGLFGGTETRAWTIAQGLAKLPDVEVSFVVRNHSLSSPAVVKQVRIVPWQDAFLTAKLELGEQLQLTPGWPYFKVSTWNWFLPWLIIKYLVLKLIYPHKNNPLYTDPFLKTLNSDFYLAFGVHSTAARIISTCKNMGRSAIVFLGADSDLDDRYHSGVEFRTRYNERASICSYVLNSADLIVAQKKSQMDSLWENFHIMGWLFPNPIDSQNWQNSATDKMDEWLKFLTLNCGSQCPVPYCLWIGRAETFHKRADLMLEIANRLPHISCLMIMNPKVIETEQLLQQKRPPNLHLIKSVPFELMPAVFKCAKAFVSTSMAEYEGFPNTMLQASILKVPIFSLDAGSDFLATYHTGWHFEQQLDLLISKLAVFWSNSAENTINDDTQKNVVEQHDLDNLCQLFHNHLVGMMKSNANKQAR